MGIKTVIFAVGDLDAAKRQFGAATGTEPVVDRDDYVQFHVGDQEVGLRPNTDGAPAGAAVYFQVDDIAATLDAIVKQGAEVNQDVNEVMPGRKIASARNADGTVIGLIQLG